MESTSIAHILDEQQHAEPCRKVDLFAPELYLKTWLQSLALLDSFHKGHQPERLSAVDTNTIQQYIKVRRCELSSVPYCTRPGRACLRQTFMTQIETA